MDRIDKAKIEIRNAAHDLRVEIIGRAYGANQQEMKILQNMLDEISTLERKLTENQESVSHV